MPRLALVRAGAWLDQLWRDVQYASRRLGRERGFTLATTLSLSLAIGLNTALFSVLNALMLRALPVSRPTELFLVQPGGVRAIPQLSYPSFRELRDAAPASTLAAISRVARMYATVPEDTARQVTAIQLASGEYFEVLGVTPQVGRLLRRADDDIAADPVAVISDAFWRRRFASAPDIVGRQLTVNGTDLTIIGVTPAGFSGVWLEAPVDVWVPVVMQASVKYAQNYYNNGGDNAQSFVEQRAIRWLEIVARVHDSNGELPSQLRGTFQQSLRRDVDAAATPHDEAFLKQSLAFIPFARGLSTLRGRFAAPLYVLLGLAALILVIACANTANLLLARAANRQREIAIQLSIGASRGQLIRQLLTESAVLAAVAMGIGIFFAAWAGNILVRMALATSGPLPFSATIDARVLGFTVLVTTLTVLLFGLAPAFRATRIVLAPALKTSSIGRPAGIRMQSVLIVSQTALSLTLLIAAVLLVTSLRNYLRVDLGFRPESVVSLWLSPRAGGVPKERLPQLYRDLVTAAERVPGVRSASVAVCGLAVGCDNASSGVDIEGYQPAPGEQTRVQENAVSVRYFETVGMRLLEGRLFDEHDNEPSPTVAIVNQTMVRRYFGNQSPLGRRFGDGRGRFLVIGVVADGRVNRVQDTARPMAFFPITQMINYAGTLDVRAAGDPEAISNELRRSVNAVDSRVPVDRITMLSRQIELNLSQERLVADVASVFGALALALSCVGICGLMSYVVSRRRSDFAIRMALGATSVRVCRSVISEAVVLTVVGITAGISGILIGGQVLKGLLFGITPANPFTIVWCSLVCLVLSLSASAIPAWRALRVDPLAALRSE
jgi:predicted permease